VVNKKISLSEMSSDAEKSDMWNTAGKDGPHRGLGRTGPQCFRGRSRMIGELK
jgi:hypothetical protein